MWEASGSRDASPGQRHGAQRAMGVTGCEGSSQALRNHLSLPWNSHGRVTLKGPDCTFFLKSEAKRPLFCLECPYQAQTTVPLGPPTQTKASHAPSSSASDRRAAESKRDGPTQGCRPLHPARPHRRVTSPNVQPWGLAKPRHVVQMTTY